MRRFLILLASILPRALKLGIYRSLGMKIGQNVSVGFGTMLFCTQAEMQDRAYIGHFCLIRVNVLRLGKRASISNFVRIDVHTLEMRSQATISSETELSGVRADERSTVYMGPASWILPHCFINVSRSVTLGRNVGVGGGSYLFTHGMWLPKLDGYPLSYGSITIGNDVWLPWGCFVMPNITLQDGTVVGACSVVTKSLPAGVLAAGVPAKIIREHSRTELTREQRADVLVEITEIMAAKIGAKARTERTLETDRHFINDRCVLVLHKSRPLAYEPLPILNVQFDKLDDNACRVYAIWSLREYRSSSFDMFPRQVLDWFENARELGTRFYPLDEDFD
jgi:acetyltransferase-like isoleucine patch superfamily enzyme